MVTLSPLVNAIDDGASPLTASFPASNVIEAEGFSPAANLPPRFSLYAVMTSYAEIEFFALLEPETTVQV